MYVRHSAQTKVFNLNNSLSFENIKLNVYAMKHYLQNFYTSSKYHSCVLFSVKYTPWTESVTPIAK